MRLGPRKHPMRTELAETNCGSTIRGAQRAQSSDGMSKQFNCKFQTDTASDRNI